MTSSDRCRVHFLFNIPTSYATVLCPSASWLTENLGELWEARMRLWLQRDNLGGSMTSSPQVLTGYLRETEEKRAPFETQNTIALVSCCLQRLRIQGPREASGFQ